MTVQLTAPFLMVVLLAEKKFAVFNPTETDKIRITITHAKAPPVLRAISAYHFSL